MQRMFGNLESDFSSGEVAGIEIAVFHPSGRNFERGAAYPG
jgi:hypothetical protein